MKNQVPAARKEKPGAFARTGPEQRNSSRSTGEGDPRGTTKWILPMASTPVTRAARRSLNKPFDAAEFRQRLITKGTDPDVAADIASKVEAGKQQQLQQEHEEMADALSGDGNSLNARGWGFLHATETTIRVSHQTRKTCARRPD